MSPWGGSSLPCPTGASVDTCSHMGAESQNPIGVYYVPKIYNEPEPPKPKLNTNPYGNSY